jgi:hypothetical protein
VITGVPAFESVGFLEIEPRRAASPSGLAFGKGRGLKLLVDRPTVASNMSREGLKSTIGYTDADAVAAQTKSRSLIPFTTNCTASDARSSPISRVTVRLAISLNKYEYVTAILSTK